MRTRAASSGRSGAACRLRSARHGRSAVAAQQQRVDRGGERRAVECAAIERRVLARRGDVVDEAAEARRRQRPALGRLGEPRRKRRGIGQRGQARPLRRRARQEARRRRVVLQEAVLHQRVERAPTASAAASAPASSAAETATSVPASGAPTSARRAASRSRSDGVDRAQVGELAAPRRRQHDERERRERRERDDASAQPRQHGRGALHQAPELLAQAGAGRAVGRDHREDPARHRRGGEQAGEREHAELGEAREAREDERGEADQRGEEAEPHRRPAVAQPAPACERRRSGPAPGVAAAAGARACTR
jgi:hypothetical protein